MSRYPLRCDELQVHAWVLAAHAFNLSQCGSSRLADLLMRGVIRQPPLALIVDHAIRVGIVVDLDDEVGEAHGQAVAPTSVFGVIFMVQPAGMFTPSPFSM